MQDLELIFNNSDLNLISAKKFIENREKLKNIRPHVLRKLNEHIDNCISGFCDIIYFKVKFDVEPYYFYKELIALQEKIEESGYYIYDSYLLMNKLIHEVICQELIKEGQESVSVEEPHYAITFSPYKDEQKMKKYKMNKSNRKANNRSDYLDLEKIKEYDDKYIREFLRGM